MNGFAARRPAAALVASLLILTVLPARAADPAPAVAESAPVQPDAASAGSTAGKDAPNAADARPEPRHGARSKASDGSLLVYDKVLGAYRSTGHDATYWIEDRFWRFDNGAWTRAAGLAGPWEAVSGQVVPKAVREHHSAAKPSTTIVLPSGREAVFEPRLKAHKVVGRKGVFLVDEHYYRYEGGIWFESATDDGPWQPTSAKPLPPPLKRALPAPVHGDKVTLPSGETLVYNADTKLYDIEGRPAAVFFDGAFYERREERWMRSNRADAGMEPVELVDVPVPVRAKYHTPAGGKKAPAQKKAAGKANGKVAANRKAGTGKQAVRREGAGAAARTQAQKQQKQAEEPQAREPVETPAGASPEPAASGH